MSMQQVLMNQSDFILDLEYFKEIGCQNGSTQDLELFDGSLVTNGTFTEIFLAKEPIRFCMEPLWPHLKPVGTFLFLI